MGRFLLQIFPLVLVLFVCCSKKQDPIIGTWKAQQQYTKIYNGLNSHLNHEQTVYDIPKSGISFKTIELKEDGTAILTINDSYIPSNYQSATIQARYKTISNKISFTFINSYVDGKLIEPSNYLYPLHQSDFLHLIPDPGKPVDFTFSLSSSFELVVKNIEETRIHHAYATDEKGQPDLTKPVQTPYVYAQIERWTYIRQ